MSLNEYDLHSIDRFGGTNERDGFVKGVSKGITGDQAPNPPIRVLLATQNHRPYGSERVVHKLANLLRDQGIAVAVLCPPRGWLVDQLRGEGHSLIFWKNHYPEWMRRLMERRAIRRWSPDLINSHSERASYRIETMNLPYPHVVTIHNEYPGPRLSQQCLPTTPFIATCQRVKQNAVEQGIAASSIRVIFNGVPPSSPAKQPFANPLGLAAHTPFIAVVGRMSTNRCTDLLLQTWPLIALRHPNLHLVFLGEPNKSFRPELESILLNLDYRDRVHFPGLVLNVPEWLKESSVVIHLSKTDALSMVAMEAMAEGKPMIVSDTGGVTEAITDGVNGFVIPQTQESIVDAVDRLLSDPNLCSRFGETSRIRISNDFTETSMISNYIDYFETLVGNSSVGNFRERLWPSTATTVVPSSALETSK